MRIAATGFRQDETANGCGFGDGAVVVTEDGLSVVSARGAIVEGVELAALAFSETTNFHGSGLDAGTAGTAG